MALGASGVSRTFWRPLGAAAAISVSAIWAFSWLTYSGAARHEPSAAAFAWMRPQVGPHDLIFTLGDSFEDLIVYRLATTVGADQLLSREGPVYTGKPPRPLLVPRAPDPDWPDRMREAIASRQRAGRSFQIWIIRKGFTPDTVHPSSPEMIAQQTHVADGHFTYPDFRGTSIVRYVPRVAPSGASNVLLSE
jgi:hypothetical protein